jgi:hypothetical protein
MMLLSNRRQCNTLDHREVMSMPLSPRNVLSRFSCNLFFRKRTARLSPAVQVREETPLGKGSDSGRSCRVSYFADPKALRIDEAQFSVHAFLCSGGSHCCRSCRRNADTLFEKECSDNPDRLPQQNDIMPSPAALSRAVILRSETSVQVSV